MREANIHQFPGQNGGVQRCYTLQVFWAEFSTQLSQRGEE